MNLNTNTTLIKVSSVERPAVEKICKLIDIHVRCYSLEEDNIVVAEIFTNDESFSKVMSRLVKAEMENIKAATPTLAL
jgi:glutamate synthase domain-containing protein 3